MRDITAVSEKAPIKGKIGHHHDAEHETAGLDRLHSWFEAHGGSVSKVKLANLGGDMGLSLVTSGAMSRGDVVMSIPVSLCMTVESVSTCFVPPIQSFHL